MDGKKVGLEGGNLLHVTSPYLFAGVNAVGQSTGMSLIDPTSAKFVGEMLIDFSSSGTIIEALNQEQTPLLQGFHILISSPQPDAKGSDTIVALGFNSGGCGGQETALVS